MFRQRGFFNYLIVYFWGAVTNFFLFFLMEKT